MPMSKKEAQVELQKTIKQIAAIKWGAAKKALWAKVTVLRKIISGGK
jgi:hypothetical protein